MVDWPEGLPLYQHPSDRRPNDRTWRAQGVSYPEFAKQLGEHHPLDRVKAAGGIAELGLNGGPEEPIIISRMGQNLDEINWRVRKAAADALGELSTAKAWGREPSSAASRAIPELVKRLADEDIRVRRAIKKPLEKLRESGALGNMADINRVAQPAVPDLLRRLCDDDWRVREVAAKAIGDLGTSDVTAMTELVRNLADDGSRVRNAAKVALDKLYASRAMVHISIVGAGAVPELTEKIDHDDWHVRCAAAWGLGQVGACHVVGALQLQKDLSDTDWAVRLLAVEAFADVGYIGMAAVPEISLRIDDAEERVQAAAKTTLAKISSLIHRRCPTPTPVVHRLARAMEDRDPQNVVQALKSLSDLGHLARPAVPDIMRHLVHEMRSVRTAAKDALFALGECGVLGSLGESSPAGTSESGKELAVKPLPQPVLKLVERLEDENWAVRFGAAEALSNLSITASYVISKLQATADADADYELCDMRLRIAADRMLDRLEEAGALVFIEDTLNVVVPELMEYAEYNDFAVGQMAKTAMESLYQADLVVRAEPEELRRLSKESQGRRVSGVTDALAESLGFGAVPIGIGEESTDLVVQMSPARSTTQCPACQNVIRGGGKFCGKCGHPRPEDGWPQAILADGGELVGQ